MNNNGSKPLMLIFTVGPAQSFIEASRKTEDMWMSSYILSYLVATAMDEVIRGGNVKLIYPAIGTESPFDFWIKKPRDFSTPSFPNLFLAIGNEISQDVLVKRAKCAEASVKTEFEQMAKRVLDKAFVKGWRKTYVETLYNQQIPDFFDVYWVITEREKDQDYKDWYANTAGNLAAIKNCRPFKQTIELGRKCSLDGVHEILHLKRDESPQKAMGWWEKFAKNRPKDCRQGEALCAVSLTKRLGMHFLEDHSKFSKAFLEKRPKFPSTSEVATASFKERLVRKPCTLEDYQDFCQSVRDLRESDDENVRIPTVDPLPKIRIIPNNVDGEWLYEETWSDAYLLRYYGIDASKKAAQIRRCKKLRRKIVRSLGGEPGKYYAVIALDADNMGAKNREAKSQEQHEERSRGLIKYTETARSIVEKEYLGKLTYAGGDDLLALVNLNDLLPILKNLRKKFPDFTSVSAGVCIAHNKMPLNNVLEHARRMEQRAKSDGRNAFGIALFKHSGNASEVVTKWKPQYTDLDVIAISEELAKLLRDDEVSKRFLYTFRDVCGNLVGDDVEHSTGLSPLVGKEFSRLIERAYKRKGQQLGDAAQDTISKTVALLPPHITPYTNYLGFLEIINFIARESK